MVGFVDVATAAEQRVEFVRVTGAFIVTIISGVAIVVVMVMMVVVVVLKVIVVVTMFMVVVVMVMMVIVVVTMVVRHSSRASIAFVCMLVRFTHHLQRGKFAKNKVGGQR